MSNTIAGTVYAGGVGVVGATVSWTGTSSGSTTSGAGGAYTTSALGAGTYMLTCADTGYSFSTPFPQTIVASNITGINFVVNPNWLGQKDTNSNWMDSNNVYSGSPERSAYWLGQEDTLGDWMDSNGVYTSYVNFTPNPPFPPVPPGVQPPLFAGFYGLTWLKNIAVLTRDYWDESLTTPYSGQLWPLSYPGSITTGQLYPF